MGVVRVVSADWIAQKVGELLGGRTVVHVDSDLLNLDGFSSLTVVALVDAIEEQIGHELPVAVIGPETFSSPAVLADSIDRTSADRSTRGIS